MDVRSSIQWAKAEIEKLPAVLHWRDSVLKQLSYCAAVHEGAQSPERLEQLTMGLILVREMGGCEPDTLQKTVSSIQYELQQQHLSYAAKARLGIQRRT